MRKTFTLLVFALLLTFTPQNVKAKDYSITEANFLVQLNKDCSADITETRTYNFDGSFSWAEMWIPTRINRQGYTYDAQIQNFIATAINIGKRTTDLSPLNVDNWEQRANIYRSVMGYINGAEQWTFDAYQEASNLAPQNPLYYFELGRSYVLAVDLITPAAQKDKTQEAKMNEYLGKAEVALSRAVEAKPDYAPALFQLALVYDRQGKTDEAIVKMVETKNAYPNDVGVAFQLGLLYYKKASWTPAAAEFERAILLDANYSNARYFLGLVYDRQGDKAKAIDQFEKVLFLNPGNQDLITIIANLRAGKPAIPEVPKNPSELPVNDTGQ